MGCEVKQSCNEIHGRFLGTEGYRKNRNLIHSMNEHGYVSDTFEELTFIHSIPDKNVNRKVV